MSELLVVEGCTFSCTNGATATVLTPMSVVSGKVKCGGMRVYTSLVVSVSLAGYTTTTGPFTGSTTKAKAGGLAMVLKNQTITVSLPKIPPPPDCPNMSVDVSILNAGQSTTKAA